MPLLILFLSLSSTSNASPIYDELIKSLVKGITQDKVISILGTPTDLKCSEGGIRSTVSPSDCWVYVVQDGYMQVYFQSKDKLFDSTRYQNGLNIID